jgi:hypothetical protein
MKDLGPTPFEYSRIETQTIKAFPDLRSAAEEYWMYEGPPGDDSGPYIFFSDVVARYLEILLAMPGSVGRNRLLDQSFEIIDQMLKGDAFVAEMVWISIFEGQARWWLGEVRQFLGPRAHEMLDEHEPGWQISAMDRSSEGRDEIIDLYGAGDVVLDQLRNEGIGPQDVPGIRVPRAGRSMSSLDKSRRDENGVVFLSCFGTSHPYVVAAASEVACEQDALMDLATDLAKLNLLSSGEREPSEVGYYKIFVGERVWRMFGPDYAAASRPGMLYQDPALVEHERWTGHTWLCPFFPLAVQSRIRSVLSGQSMRL